MFDEGKGTGLDEGNSDFLIVLNLHLSVVVPKDNIVPHILNETFLASGFSLIQRLPHSTGIVNEQPSVNREFDLSRSNDAASLTSVSHDGNFPMRTDVGETDMRVDGVVVTSNRLIDDERPSGTIVEDSQLLFESI